MLPTPRTNSAHRLKNESLEFDSFTLVQTSSYPHNKMQRGLALLTLPVFLLLASSLRTTGQSPCPDPVDILPCSCIQESDTGDVIVDCSRAASSDEIYSAFNDAFWPFTELKRFKLEDNTGVRDFPEGLFGDVSFERIHLSRTTIGSLHPGAILSSKDRLSLLGITYSALVDFPWDVLPQLTNLSQLNLSNNSLTVLPQSQSSSLQYLMIENNQVAEIQAGSSLPNLNILMLSIGPNSRVILADNRISELTEAAFRPMVEPLSQGEGYIVLYGNPVDCGCSIAWWVLNPDFRSTLQGRCPGGTSFQDLDPEDYQDCIK
ncbi:unnamed protein product [Darwinula stevensoni]|uniref:Oplophorus-luciferin 2-monooxygenase non-catalytic subunit n=1 Tax=Darwinula stevensoni TaxID=69355 RepID=A0A7R9ACN4_9CRUS|nr:unnamed protein product [Darwinula stevensoni]CAG0900176.1 unnamed protein product [Darwinula stevensoni]